MKPILKTAGRGLPLLVAMLLTGCSSIGYYTQAVKGHCQILSRQTACEKLLVDDAVPSELKARLKLARELCWFAEAKLDLPAHGAYRRYADLGRPYVVWNVYAAPEFSLEAKTWWYPIVGSLDYRGYFSESGARHYADQLAGKGLDVYVEGVEAYSTLGWFKDPLLNTFLHHEEPILAEVLFHELAHQRVFASGDTDFNEAFATSVARAGVRRWLKAQGDHELLECYEAAQRRDDAFVSIVQQARQRLEHLYTSADANVQDSLELGKQRVLTELRKDFDALLAESGEYAGYAPWFTGELNNAKLNSVATYYDLVPAFEELLASSDDNLIEFYAEAEHLSRLKKEERHRQMQDLISDRGSRTAFSTLPATEVHSDP